MYNLWNTNSDFPTFKEMKDINGIEHIDVHTAIKDEYQFLLGAAIIKHNNIFRSSWANSFRKENDNNTILSEKCSYDNGRTWTDYKKISRTDKEFGRSHGVYFEHKEKLYAFCPKAKYNKVDSYPDLKMEAYVLNEHGEWEYLDIVLDADFWPMCEPLTLDDGTFLMAGLKTDDVQAAVALCDGKDITKWEIKVLPNAQGFEYWGETTVLKHKDKLIAIVRGGKDLNCALISESYDNGQTWSDLEKSNFVISQSKMYAVTLSTGESYLVFSSKDETYRDTLCIAVGNDSFDRIYVIRHGFDELPRFFLANEWCYPYAYEDEENKKLYVVYAKNKEDCELAIIPIESISNR